MKTAEKLRLLRRIDILQEIPGEALDDLARDAEGLELAAGDILIRQGDRGEAMYFLAAGRLEVRVRQRDGSDAVVAAVAPGQPVGEIQVILGGRRSATVAAKTASRLLRIHEFAFRDLERRSPESFVTITEIIRRRLLRDQLATAVEKLFGEVDRQALDLIEDGVEWIRLRRGEVLFRQGDAADSWYILVSGRLKVVIEGADGPRVVNELGRGESFGELAIFLDSDRTASIHAARDCAVARISRRTFERILDRRPEFMAALTRVLVRRIVDKEARTAGLEPLVTLTAVPLHEGAPIADLCRRLAAELERIGPTLHAGSGDLASLLGITGASELADGHPAWIRFSAWLDELETRCRFLLLEADPRTAAGGATAWTRRCLHRADRILLVGDAGSGPPAAGEAELPSPAADGSALTETPRTLVLVHRDGRRLPRGTAAWRQAHPAAGHVHLRWDGDADFGRLARLLAGTSVGLVLGGGGAKGFAHIGVLRACRELGMPVDLVGGTSMGAIIGGMCAMGFSPREMRDLNLEVIGLRPFSDYTLPLISLIRSRRTVQGARHSFGEARIEDLWIDFFCVSANLTAARIMIHDSGPLWQATQASAALPGILEPVLHGREVLVDGGVIDNLPGGVMRQRHRGPVIAVDVGTEDYVESPVDEVPSPYRMLWNKILPGRRPIGFPSIGDILMRTLTLGSVSRTHEAKTDADLCLEPPIQKYGMLDFEKIDELIEVGYRHGMERLATWLEDGSEP